LNKEHEIVMSTNSPPPTRRSVLKIAAAGGALGLITSASSSIVNPARCGHADHDQIAVTDLALKAYQRALVAGTQRFAKTAAGTGIAT
jgi:hypothetical protein